ncbi:hypothetical protein F5Y16DRAFT_387533 [Xylariaceae sp. FL0255]|nr:hypothetical protein F5Y16DRAFT_387533 [Xylariaceae sp. FL0255]
MAGFVQWTPDLADESSSENEEYDDPGRLRLPGFGKSLKDAPSEMFVHALAGSRHQFKSEGLKLREVRMMAFMNQITDKPRWEEKVFDETIVARWREEAMSPEAQASMNLDGDVYMSEEMFEYCIKELRDKVPEFKECGIVNILDAEIAVAKSDSAISKSLAEALKKALKPLEVGPDHLKDWHPGSDGKVLDLVHPSLFPMVYGTTPVLPFGDVFNATGKVPLEGCEKFTGKGETYQVDEVKDDAVLGSTQWLPSDITWTASGGTKIDSYINNLHPTDHADLYNVLEDFVTATVPLWERCLFKKKGSSETRISGWGESEAKYNYRYAEGVKYDRPPLREGEGEDDYLWTEAYHDWDRQNRILQWMQPNEYDPQRARQPERRQNLRKDFPEGLQVIFKLANIHLTPEKPEYGGGSLHIEGALNDRIVATALYYYDFENITESQLQLHHTVDAEELRMIPEQGEFEYLERWLGISSDDIPLQPLGSVVARSGRLVAFPNVLAHQVKPFKLADPARPGHRKILAMFLVDPHLRVLSTSVVPPQRMDWWSREVRKVAPFNALPLEIYEMIINNVDGLMTWEDGEAVRETLMQERMWVKDAFEETLQENFYSFCEH